MRNQEKNQLKASYDYLVTPSLLTTRACVVCLLSLSWLFLAFTPRLQSTDRRQLHARGSRCSCMLTNTYKCGSALILGAAWDVVGKAPLLKSLLYTNDFDILLTALLYEMAEAIAAISLAATIIQVIDFSSKVVTRLHEFQSSLRDVPASFRQINNTLPLLCDTLDGIKHATEAGSFKDRTKTALLAVVVGCQSQVVELDAILAKSLPKAGDSRLQRGVKAMSSVGHDAKFERISKELHGYISTLTFYCTAVSSALRPLQDKTLNNVRDWLAPPDPSRNYHSALKLREADTGLWFLDGDRYAQWHLSAPSIIWCCGIPGCGKSVLSASLIENILQRCEDDPGKVVAYFYFDFKDEQKQRPELMLRSLICQFSQQCVKAPLKLQALFSSCEDKKQQPTTDDLLDVLRDMIQDYPEAYIVLDALDECGNRLDLTALLEQIISWKLGNLHLLVTSRQERDIQDSLEALLEEENIIFLQSELVDEDIRKYVRTRLLEDRNLKKWQKDSGISNEIQTALMKGSHGMFRWAACQLDSLGKCRNRLTLRNALKSLPPTLDETYDRILCSISQEDIIYATRILRWLAFSERPLTVQDVATAVAIDIDRDPVFDAEEVLEDPLDILDICHSLVRITIGGHGSQTSKTQSIDGKSSHRSDESKNKTQNSDEREGEGEIKAEEEYEDDSFRSSDSDSDSEYDSEYDPTIQYTLIELAHYSVKEYLISDRILQGPAQNYRIEATNCNDYLAQCCLGYISQPDTPILLSDVEHESNEGFEFSTYATMYWHTHAMVAGEMTEALSLRIMDFFMTRSTAFARWARKPFFKKYYGIDTNWILDYKNTSEYPSPLHFAAFFGWEGIAKKLLESGADINCICPNITGTPLYNAAAMTNEGMTQILLSAGADPNIIGGRYGCPLQVAVVGPDLDRAPSLKIRVMEALLSGGANINLECGECFTALSAAASRDVDIVKYLLNAGAEVNSKSRLFKTTALITAAKAGRENIVKLLLDAGADIHARSEGYLSVALIAAARTDSDQGESIVKLLLDAGADVNINGGEMGYPLAVAAGLPNKYSTVKVLLTAGANIDAKAGSYGTALGEASWNNMADTVKLLLDAGANVEVKAGEYGTALQAAIHGGSIDAVKLLLAAGANINAKDGYLGTGLMVASVKGHTKIAQYLLSLGAKVNAIAGVYGTALIAATYGNKKNMLRLLLDKGADMNIRAGGFQATALHTAALLKRKEIARHLIKRGADINTRGGSGETALIAATRAPDTLELLLTAGADVNIPGHGCYSSALMKAVGEGYKRSVQLLLNSGADITAHDEINGIQFGVDARRKVLPQHLKERYGSVLEIAAANGHEEVVQLLLAAGADVNAPGGDRFGGPLDAAVQGRFKEIVELLIGAGANVNGQGGRHYCSLLEAAETTYDEDIIRLLVEAGAVHQPRETREGIWIDRILLP